MEYSVRSLDAYLRLNGAENIPIGIDLEATDFVGIPSFQKRLAAYPSKYNSNKDAEDAVRLYRKILAKADEPVEIIEIGFLQVVANLLLSKADDISEKTGMELVKEKVKKFWVMAGKWDEPNGKEHNFNNNKRSQVAGSIFCEKCPVPVTFLGFEIGADVITGDNLDENDILKLVFTDCGVPNGRLSWDPMTVLLAITGEEAKAGYDVVCGKASVNENNGENNFYPSACGKHKYVIKNKSNEYYKNQINELIK